MLTKPHVFAFNNSPPRELAPGVGVVSEYSAWAQDGEGYGVLRVYLAPSARWTIPFDRRRDLSVAVEVGEVNYAIGYEGDSPDPFVTCPQGGFDAFRLLPGYRAEVFASSDAGAMLTVFYRGERL